MNTLTYRASHERGFTLVEILIVVAIIGILASVALVGLGPVQRRGRDARRISDLRQVQTGLELYYGKCGFYPGAAQSGTTCTGSGGGLGNNWAALSASLEGSNIGVSKVPADPLSNRSYDYGSLTGTTYVLGASLEDLNNSVLNGDIDGASVEGVNCGTGGAGADTKYCIQL